MPNNTNSNIFALHYWHKFSLWFCSRMIMSNYIVHPLSRAKHIKALAHVSLKEDEDTKSPGALPVIKNESCERILEKVWFTLHKLTCSFICLYLSKLFNKVETENKSWRCGTAGAAICFRGNFLWSQLFGRSGSSLRGCDIQNNFITAESRGRANCNCWEGNVYKFSNPFICLIASIESVGSRMWHKKIN